MSLSIEELNKIRYKVIADYPGSPYMIGGIIQRYGLVTHKEEWLNTYPHLFKKLEWYEERREEEMPEYLKYRFMEHSKWKYLKVKKHFTNSANEPNRFGFTVNGDDYNSYSKSFPITKSDYDNAINNTQ